MRKFTKPFLVFFIATILLISGALGNVAQVYAVENLNSQESATEKTLENAIEKTGTYLIKNVTDPTLSSVGGEWTLLGLARSKAGVPDQYKNIYLKNIKAIMVEQKGVLTKVKYTEYSRLILALTALGEDVTRIEGYNILSYLTDLDQITKQGVNGPSFALLALDSKGYELPKSAVDEVNKSGGKVAKREALIDYLLLRGPQEGDVDRTAMMLQGLAHYQNDPRVKTFGEKAFAVIAAMENTDGTFQLGENDTSESLIQAIIAKERWGKTVDKNIEALMGYMLSDGSFEHIKGQGTDLMATEQALYAMVNHQRTIEGKPDLYDMKDVVIGTGITVLLDGKSLLFDQSPIIEMGRTLVPMRGIFEAFGATVSYEPKGRVVTGVLEGKTVVLTIGSTKARVNGKEVTLDVPAKIVNSRTLVPLRFVGESLDAAVDWIDKTKTVVIIR